MVYSRTTFLEVKNESVLSNAKVNFPEDAALISPFPSFTGVSFTNRLPDGPTILNLMSISEVDPKIRTGG